MDNQSAVQQLITLIENSSKIKYRLESLRILRKISSNYEKYGGKRDFLISFFENLLISDTDEIIRNEAALILCQDYKDKALNPMSWALHHEESQLCLQTIFNSLIKLIEDLTSIKEPIAKLIMVHEIKQISDKDFNIGFEILKSVRGTSDFTLRDLADILINYYAIVYLKKSFWRLKYRIEECKIIELDFIFKGLTKLPSAIKHLTYLKKLILRYNQITELPDWIESLHALESLNLNVNNINKLPTTIGSLSHLTELMLWKNELHDLPDSICSLHSLKYLNLRLNQIKRLPYDLGNLINLIELNLHDNKLNEIPESISSLRSLEKLNLSWNLLESLPSSISNLISLKSLDIERNELVQIPISIGSLTSLEILNLGDNKIEKIPETIGNLKKLRILNISRNRLTSLPKSLDHLENLEELYISENKLDINSNFLQNLKNKGLKIYL